jgi:hypothetical protein
MAKSITWMAIGAAYATLAMVPAWGAARAVRRGWPPETLSGTIDMVRPNQRLLVVKGPDGVLFDMVVTKRTSLERGNQPVDLNQITNSKNQPVSVQFTPEGRGDVAQSVRITG